MPERPDGIPIKQLTFGQVKNMQIAGWVYPRRRISQILPLFPKVQQSAINVFGWIAILMVPVGIGLTIWGSPWWLLMLPGAWLAWKANRMTMEQYFVENLTNDPTFYEAIRGSSISDATKVVPQK